MTNKKSSLANLFDLVTFQSILSDLSHAVALERLGPVVTERVCWRALTNEPRIALTFDDGPQSRHTPDLLNILDKHGVKATFFLIGKHIKENLTLTKEMVKAGHEVGNHTFSHPLLWRLEDAEIKDEIQQTDSLLRSLDGVEPKYLRPPMGLFSKRVLNIVEEMGYKTVVGDVYPRDSHLPGKHKIVDRVLSRVLNGSIIILHDGGNTNHVDRHQTLWAVEKLIPLLQARGFEFVTLSQLIDSTV